MGNISCGYDILGLALEKPGDIVKIERKEQRGINITSISGDQQQLPTNPQKNTAGVAAQKFLEEFKIDVGLEMEIEKHMPTGSGLGSSAASAAAVLFGLNKLFGQPADRKTLVKIGIQSESVACGSGHADNIAPSLLGGIILIRSIDQPDIVNIHSPKNIFITLVYPHIEIKTEEARDILPHKIKLSQAVKQWGNIAGLISGFYTEDLDLIGRSMPDHIIEPVRSKLIPGYNEVKNEALKNGALGCSISGSGPTLFAFSENRTKAYSIGKKMEETFRGNKMEANSWVSKINTKGAQEVDQQIVSSIRGEKWYTNPESCC